MSGETRLLEWARSRGFPRHQAQHACKQEKMGACMEGGMVKNLGKKKAATKVGTTLPKRRDDSTRLCSLTSPISWTQIGEKKNGVHTF